MENAIIQQIYDISNVCCVGWDEIPHSEKYFLDFKNSMSTINPYLISPSASPSYIPMFKTVGKVQK